MYYIIARSGDPRLGNDGGGDDDDGEEEGFEIAFSWMKSIFLLGNVGYKDESRGREKKMGGFLICCIFVLLSAQLLLEVKWCLAFWLAGWLFAGVM